LFKSRDEIRPGRRPGRIPDFGSGPVSNRRLRSDAYDPDFRAITIDGVYPA
jgi:hypothetical protein